MPLADIIILIVIAFSLWKGLSRGLVREAMALMGWLVGLVLAINGYERFATVLAPFIQTPSLQKAAAFVMLCLGMVVLSYLIALMLEKLLKALALGPADKLMGAMFGVVRGVLIVLLAIGLLAPFLQQDTWWHEASLPNTLLPYVPVAHQLTDEIKQHIRQDLPKIKVQLPNPQTQPSVESSKSSLH
ncbi:CvpA family protein [Agitococcus lubricus]|uniref:Membrane protein required for colicin V production n=1 Tax=Agitococcus lubricus TaxID=1077255 RepID=A0A2T5IWZ2_9GAMM|nr:CvpA family protein [Agitococcus lubricus]PTQ88454.1 membrane protein required for colicin V production [Agitococcus lubricus]